MITINGREVGFAYTIGAHCDFTDYIVTHGQNVSASRGTVRKALAMNKAYNSKNGIKDGALTEAEILGLDFADFSAIEKEIEAVEKRDSVRTVETKPKKE